MLLAALVCVALSAQIAEVRYDFSRPLAASSFVATQGGEGARKDALPHAEDGRLALVGPWWKSWTSAAFSAPGDGLYRVLDAQWNTVLTEGTEGFSFAWLPTDPYGANGAAPAVDKWEEPSIPGAFAVGFDALDPVNREPFRGSGNIEGRAQHEASLFWNGREIVKAVTPVEYRDGMKHAMRVHVEFVAGGANATVSIDSQPVWKDFFVAGMTPYVGRPAFGARNGETAGEISLGDLHVTESEPTQPPEPPFHVAVFDHELNDKDKTKNTNAVDLPADNAKYARIVMTLRLDQPKTRFDPWDRIANIKLIDDDGQAYELLRYITPYNHGWEWKVDVTDFRPLLRGKKTIVQECVTYGEGWLVSVSFDYYPGKVDKLAYKVVNLWSGSPEIGNPDKPTTAFYVPRTIPTDRFTTGAKVRTVVTGHGMEPNTDNAGEFMPLGRTLKVGGQAFRNLLWKTDNYLNPCRPQGGTWKYDRAGWGPGDVVRPWEVDATRLFRPGRPIHVEYKLEPYLNEGRGKTWAPTHVTEAQLVLYRNPH